MKKILTAVLAMLMLAAVISGCGKKKKEIIIYASSEDFRIENAQKMFDAKFPEYNIRIEYKSTGDLSSKLYAEGKKTDCDIIMELENSYLEKISDSLAVLKDVDFSIYEDGLVPESRRYVPMYKSGGAVIVNKKMLDEKNLPVPSSYDDLIKPEYKGLISMPNPKSSGTGYIFYLNRVNVLGEEKALEYFDRLKENISGAGFTTSGSGPVNALKMGEAAIALGMTFQAVTEINNGADYDIMKVFEYLVSDVIPKDKELFAPEKIYKNVDYTIKNYPTDIKYADMTGVDKISVKESLLDKWKY